MFRFNITVIREPTVCASLKLQYWRQLKYFVNEVFGRVVACVATRPTRRPHFNKCHISALPDDGDYTETCWSCFNVNFKIVLRQFNCASVGENKYTLINI